MKKLLAIVVSLMLVFSMSAIAESTVLTYESRGAQIPATLVTPDGLETYPVVVLIHGHGGSREENVGFGAIADALAAQGIGSIRMDFPGCGESTESFQLNTMTNMKADVAAAIEYVKANVPASKIGLLGYSMGGRIILEMLTEGASADAVAFLAPAADNEDLKLLFGGVENYASLNATADAEGYVTFTTIYGSTQELSKEWFADLKVYGADLAAQAADKYEGAAIVIWGQDDEAVNPAISANVAELFAAQTVEATGEGHGYGFYSEDDAVRNLVAASFADFFAANLK